MIYRLCIVCFNYLCGVEEKKDVDPVIPEDDWVRMMTNW